MSAGSAVPRAAAALEGTGAPSLHGVGAAAVDLSSCDREPIHIPGSIQPHGFLLSLDPETLRVREASENAAGYLGQPLQSVFGSTPAEVLGAERGQRLAAELTQAEISSAPRLLSLLHAGEDGGAAFEVLAHRSGTEGEARIVVEFEHVRSPVDAGALDARLFNFISLNRGDRSVDEVLGAAVVELRALTGCGRVVLYCFDEEGHGVVLAEDHGSEFDSYLGLHFPASDVPQQARRMYERNRVRIIPDVDYTPSPLVSEGGAAGQPFELDLSSSVLRSVSPVHRAYMRNMGTACSMSVSILVNQRLWGLVSCHHHQPRYVPLRVRSACDWIMQAVAAQIESQQARAHLSRVLASRSVQSRLLAAMAGSAQYMDGLLQHADLLMSLVEAEGAAVVRDGGIHLVGTTPTEAEVSDLADWLAAAKTDEVFVSSALSDQYPAAVAYVKSASGVLAASLSKVNRTQVIWFRAELVTTVKWAGDPRKPAVPADGGWKEAEAVVDPRHSFEAWSQMVRCRSRRWTTEEMGAAVEFRRGVLEIVLKRAEELAEMAAGLKVANEELEAFSYSVSHDLRAPFRHISGFSEMLREEEWDRMSGRGRHYLGTIMESARFAGLLVDSLLDLSRIARVSLERMAVNLERLMDEEWSAVFQDEGRGRSIEYKRGALPVVLGDAALIRQVVRNLLSNAVKYTAKVAAARVEVGAYEEGREVVVLVKDNGAGFDQSYADKLFGVFQRLHRAEEFEGTGIGLANVRRIVSRHGGRTWAEGKTGEGATFCFSLPATLVEGGDRSRAQAHSDRRGQPE
ncbi:MAG TPA: ATP-binding protein [Acidobacteriaceae bacterium]